MQRSEIKFKKRWVVKVGSALLTNEGQGLHTKMLDMLANQVAFLRTQGVEVLLVSSGSIAAGVSQLGVSTRPTKLNQLQAAAAVGQAALVRAYEVAFEPENIQIAQILLTHADIANRERYLNARGTLLSLLEMNVLAIINENDSVANEEICFGDNDSLAALVANLVDADLLVLLTDQDGLYTADPRSNPDASLIETARADDDELNAMASGGGTWGRGGMVTKLTAAQIASRSGASTIIANGRQEKLLESLYHGENLGTLLSASQRLASKKQWLAGQMHIAGTVVIDDGAEKVLRHSGRSLLPVGVLNFEGDFKRGELVSCRNQQGLEVARGLVNYSSKELVKLKGQASADIAELLGYGGEDELIHRDHLVIISKVEP